MSESWWRDRDEFQRRLEAAGWNISLLADEMDMAVSTMQRWKQRHGIEFPPSVNPKGNHRSIAEARNAPPPLVPILDDELHLEGDAALSSDWHAPITCYETFNRFLDDAHSRGITQGICAGDLFNFDQWSRHEHPQLGAGATEDLAAGAWCVSAALDVFDHLYVSLGNHEVSLHRKLDYAVTFDGAMRMALEGVPDDKRARITITGRDYVIVHTERGPWRVAHTRSYSRQPLAYPNKVSARYGCHVAAGHRHHHAQGFGATGKSIVELGGFMDESRMAYANRWTTDFPAMQRGYALLLDGWAVCPMLSG